MIVGPLFLIIAAAQNPAPEATPTREQLAERFVIAATSEPMPSQDDDGADILADELIQANPGREVEARQIAQELIRCMRRDGRTAMHQAAIEAALAFNIQQLERLISFVEMRDAQRREGAPNTIPPDWEAARSDYGRWMYSIGGQPSAVALAQRCGEQMAASMAAARLRN